MADDLADDWWVQEDLSEDENKEEHKEEEEEEGKEIKNKTDLSIKKKPKKERTKKRKLDDLTNKKSSESANDIQPKKKKKKKRKGNKKEHSDDDLPPTVETLWNYFEKKLQENLTEIEIEDVKPTHEWYIEEQETPRETDKFSDFLQNVIPDWTEKCAEVSTKKCCKSPVLLVVTSAATRAVDVLRATMKFRGQDCKTAKLFAKHMKIEDQLEKMKKNVIHLGVGTPNRILKLIENGGINIKRLQYVVIDWSWKDVKQRSLGNMPGVKDDFMLLFQNYFLTRCKKKKLAVTCF